MPKIHAKALGFSYGERVILNGIDFTIEERRIGLIGSNGSGKSTLARLIAGLLKPDQGQVLVDGHNLFDDRRVALQKLGIVFQNPDQQIIFPTVIEELKFGFSQLGQVEAEARARSVLSSYGKDHWGDRLITSLSQGQRHFLALISILEMRPEVLILDEPFTGLDIPTTMRLQNHLQSFEGMIVHITHDPSLLAGYDRALWIEDRGVFADGAVREVLPHYQATMKERGQSDAYTGF